MQAETPPPDQEGARKDVQKRTSHGAARLSRIFSPTEPSAFNPESPPSRAGVLQLRIAIVSPEVGLGAGVPHYWQGLASAMATSHDVHIFTSKADRAALAGIEIHSVFSIPWGWFLQHVSFYLAARARFFVWRLLRRRPFDLVIGIGALTPFATMATVHFVQAREIKLQSQGAFPREQPRTGLRSVDYALYSRTMGWMGRRFYGQSHTRIVAISQAVKRDLTEFEGALPEAIAVVPNGVDGELFHPRNKAIFRASTRKELGLADEHKAVLFVGNSWGRKGLRTAIEAIQGDDMTNVRLVVVGEGVPEVFLRGLPDEVAGRIVFAGKQNVQLERFYAASDVFLLPTLYEPFGLVILEALASGLPTIVSATAGASELLEHGVHAWLLENPADGMEAREALRAVLSRPELAASLTENGRQAAEDLHWSSVASRIIDALPGRPTPEPQPEAAGLEAAESQSRL